MKRIWILLVISLVGVGLFTACSSNADTMVQPSPSPSVSPSASPTATATDSPVPSAAPTITDKGMEAGVNTVEDAQRVSDEVSEEVEKLSELKSAEAVVMGTIAVVGVDGVDDALALPVLPGQLHTDLHMGALHLMVDGLAQVVQQAGALGLGHVGADLGGQQAGQQNTGRREG